MKSERIPSTANISAIVQAMKKTRRRWSSLILVLAVALGLVSFAQEAQGQTLTLLYSFTGGADGANPAGAVIRDAAGNLYGTTIGGGPINMGTVFKLDRLGKEAVLVGFSGSGGNRSSPEGG